jgi:chromosome segregation ATPase
MAKESYTDLIFQLGDLAREHLTEKKPLPRAMDGVFAAEDVLLAVRDEIAALEDELNAEAGAWQDFQDQQTAELAEHEAIKRKWRHAVAGVETRSRDLRKSLSSQKAAFRYQKVSQKRAEEKHKELEQREGHDVKKVSLSRENLKTLRLKMMRFGRNLEDMEAELKQVLTPRPGQVGAQGILAHKRVLEMEDEAEERKAAYDERMKELDAALAAKEDEAKACEEDLDAALYELGEAVYADRVAHPQLNPLYPRLDKAA